ncbi:MAG: 3-deoxy-manno-octulosonate cytidylyltransferase [Magnetococcales bacterium]|nr:3-deoxy-manno-octulosonate cytidylyltransferase [Magnetococcales bacterium]
MRTVIAIIPARYAATRLPGKPLADIAGKPMIQHVYERAARARVDRVLVATDDARIEAAVRAFGGEAMLTASTHVSGSDRVAEAARSLKADWIVNVQGDEPLLHPEMLDQLLEPLRNDPAIPMATLAHPLTDREDFLSPDVVKVVCTRGGFALYFSRAPLPVARGREGVPREALRHIGLYAYRADFLQQFARLDPTPLEQSEKLEQLRALEHGFPIRVVTTRHHALGVDTPTDLERVRRMFAQARGDAPGF